MNLIFSLLVIFGLILINGLFVAAEFAIIGVRPSRIEQLEAEGNRMAAWVHEVLSDRRKTDRYVATAQLGITLASLGLGMYGEPVIAHLIEDPLHRLGMQESGIHGISFISALTLITYLHVVLGEMVPKSISLQNAERAVLFLASPMGVVERIFSIPVSILNLIGLTTLRLLHVPPPRADSHLYTFHELELVVSESHAGGLVDDAQQELAANVFDFTERRVVQIMTPRPQIDAIPITIDESDLIERFINSPHTRLPVYEGDIDHIVGVVHLRDLVRQQLSGKPYNLRELLHQVPFVPGSLHVEDLLGQLKANHAQVAVVLDEHGGTLGIVTMEDLIEEVFGEVQDEFDADEERPLRVLGPGHLMVQGILPLADLEEYVDIHQHEHNVQTVGGLVMAELGRLPVEGDVVQIGDVQLRVEEVKGLAIRRASVHFTPAPAEKN
ncbi:MAG: hemolysin family protein [Anaerolineae bacterium]